MSEPTSTNFRHLTEIEPTLARLGDLAEQFLPVDANTTLIKLRQYAELLAEILASRAGTFRPGESQKDRLDRLRDEGLLNDEVFQLFTSLRREGNRAAHTFSGTESRARTLLRFAWQLGLWLRWTLVAPVLDPEVTSDFVEPREATTSAADLHQLDQASDHDKAVAEGALASGVVALPAVRKAAQAATRHLRLSEADTRQLIDEALQAAGWEADTQTLRYSKGTRPEKGHHRAIAEWPTATGPADYVLFVGLSPVGIVEAKRKNLDVSSALPQAERYSRHIGSIENQHFPGGPWGEFQVPFVFSTNGRPYFKQAAQLSGIWFRDVRHDENIPRPIDGWYTPKGLSDLLANDPRITQTSLEALPFQFAFPLRSYQQQAIQAIEQAIGNDQRQILVAMATGTGKTKTCIALIYRLLKTRRMKRVLFLVDRRSLGEQAAGAFKDTRMEGVQNFADIFGLAELGDLAPAPETAVHVATVQSMVARVLNPADGQAPPVDSYDCIIVDEAHRGYLLDRELSETELTFRDESEYLSTYRRVLEHFDAVRIGLTATPALHTVQIFGVPVFTYSYREAVVDGFLIDHGPPLRLRTRLSEEGVHWAAGEAVKVLDPSTGDIDQTVLPDELHFQVAAFNREVLTPDFNRVVCEELVRHLDPTAGEKTLVFCATDRHADMVVQGLKDAFERSGASVPNQAIEKITGTIEDPLRMIRLFKNERAPNIAVTVDLLTTGIDVPEICNLVFIRLVGSRILYDQMLGRATRPCDRLGKDTFRIFDAVGLYDALANITEMKPVVVQPNITFEQLVQELQHTDGEAQDEVLRQLSAKFQRRRRRMDAETQAEFETAAGMPLQAFLQRLAQHDPDDLARLFSERPGLSELLDRVGDRQARPMVISEHSDVLVGTEYGYGRTVRPQDYLDTFTAYVRENPDGLSALSVVVTRPADLTRKDLRELLLELRKRDFTPQHLDTAWNQVTNHEMAASIIGYIRQAATGEALVPFAARVDRALTTLLASRSWTKLQEKWLRTLAAQTKANGLVDRDAIEDQELIFSREGGGLRRLDPLFGGDFLSTLRHFNETVWTAQA